LLVVKVTHEDHVVVFSFLMRILATPLAGEGSVALSLSVTPRKLVVAVRARSGNGAEDIPLRG
jgi:hypothetical protein